jgi:catechol 2,3-dioxygenase-like lactoylglutathione lyase family enzyme
VVKIDLDHVAIATSDVNPILDSLVGDLGAQVLWGGANFGFRAMQVDAGDLRIELLEPYNVEQNDFLERFLMANGEGAHHLTFKTDDIVALIARIESAGYHPVGVNIDNPFWKEAFVHPKEAGGTVVQVAQSGVDSPLDIDPSVIPEDMREYGPAKWWSDPPPPAATRSILRRVVVTTDEMSVALGLYLDLLGGVREDFGEGFVDLAWPGGGRVRLEHAAGRKEGIDRLEWTHSRPLEERRVGGTRFVLSPS